MNALDLTRINRLAPYKVWTEDGCDYLIETNRDAYVMQTAEVQEGKTKNFAALIVQKSNPKLKQILAEFDETISILTDKPQ